MSELSGKKVLVTGADGFIGSHLVERLLTEGADVRALCIYNSNGSLGWLEEISTESSNLEPVLGDVRDARLVREAVKDRDYVFHLAALIAIPYSYIAPISFVDTNITGTLNVLEAVRDAGTTQLVNTSTSEVYGTPETVPITEAHPLRGQSPYSASKIAADKMCEAYALSFETPVVTIRPFNTFGPRQSPRAVIPTILSQLLAGARSVRLGSLEPQRDFTYVTDTVDAFVRMSTAMLSPGTTIQLGTGRAISIGELFDMCLKVTGSTAEVVSEGERLRPLGSEVQILLSDPAQAQDRLGWTPHVSLERGLQHTAEWLDGRFDLDQAVMYHR